MRNGANISSVKYVVWSGILIPKFSESSNEHPRVDLGALRSTFGAIILF